jgi:hypothetical protein
MTRATADPNITAALDALRSFGARTAKPDLEAERLALILVAVSYGANHQAIASTLGISRQRVGQIIEEAQETKP